MKPKIIVVAGAGGFIGGHLVRHLVDMEAGFVLAVDKKPLDQWHLRQTVRSVESHCLDLSDPEACRIVCRGADDVYNLAADMGGMGFIERFRVECMRSVLINTNLIEAAYRAQVQRYFFASSACVYNADKQKDPNVTALKETDAYPALAERGYGWEKLFSEMVCQEYWTERAMRTKIARFHNVYGPHGTWDGGREKAPAAICRKVIEALDRPGGIPEISIWGNGEQTRSFTYIDDCINGIMMIMNCPTLTGCPINLGSSELVSINGLVSKVEGIANCSLRRNYLPDAPVGVAGRNSDNTLIKAVLNWEPSTPLSLGLENTYLWIRDEYNRRKPEVHT